VDAFISHSSRNRAAAGRLEKMLEAEGLEVWLDDSEIHLGVLLVPGLIRAQAFRDRPPDGQPKWPPSKIHRLSGQSYKKAIFVR